AQGDPPPQPRVLRRRAAPVRLAFAWGAWQRSPRSEADGHARQGSRDHAARVLCPVVAGLHLGPRGPLPVGGNGSLPPLARAPVGGALERRLRRRNRILGVARRGPARPGGAPVKSPPSMS